ncbi:MAG TPA: lysophospholipid acyltransferase family protein [Anaerolineales bacterium]|nr:lysophospholipid acyltransferase family protein [Anaerolineales bacterium]
MDKLPHTIFQFIIRLMLNIIARIEMSGFEHVPASGAYVIAVNHIGRLDAALPYYIFDRPDIIMVVAEKYEKYAIFRWLVRITNGMFIDRYHTDFRAIRESLRRLQQGQLLTMTPEGTRSKTGNLQQAKPGGIYLAWKAGVPILPAAITGCEDAVVKDRLKHFKRLHIQAVAGPAFTLPAIAGKDRNAAMQQYTDEVMCRIAALLPEERRGFYADHPRLKELLAGSD